MFQRVAALIACVFTVYANEPVSFERSIKPILSARCEPCHKTLPPNSVKPGSPETSLLVSVISGPQPRMPKSGPPLSADQVATIRQWIEQGAPGFAETWWSLRPLVKPAVPKFGETKPIDAFIREKLAAAKLAPSERADRRTLARRIYFDLHGLPPTPAQVDAFVNDPSPTAYEKLVDNLLASPRYGERWARHWLDIVHYGDSHGFDKDKPRPNAWPYRDYVIEALHTDKPYARFIREQIAGDILYPGDPRAFVATGFLAAGPWDFVGHQELREGTADKNNTRLLDRDDIVATTISGFTSMTAHCARCHNHKFDPITQRDYYNLQAVFAGVDRADRPYHDDPAEHQRIQGVVRQKHALQLKLQPLQDKVEFATSPEIVALDSAIQDAGLQIAHIGPNPKDPADRALREQLDARRTADRQRKKDLVETIVGKAIFGEIAALEAELRKLDAQLANAKYVYSGADYFPRAGTFRPSLQPRVVELHGTPAQPGALTAIPVPFTLSNTESEGARRAALANWIADDRNMLTWRSIVNRVWHYHFGVGLVDTPSDFGRMGSKPTHPELLDWLAVWFRDDAKGSLKALHRLIVTSDTYQQKSAERADAASMDADNRLFWRMNRTRLDAEAVRDSVLSVAGKLDLTMGGPAVRWFAFKDDHSPVYDYARFDPDEPGAHRRSIYRFIVRSVPDPFMERLDCPDPSVLTPKRSTTLTAIQALAMRNNPFVIRMAEHFAGRLRGEQPDLPSQVRAAAKLVWYREPNNPELEAYARKHGLENLCRVLLNSSEFLFVD